MGYYLDIVIRGTYAVRTMAVICFLISWTVISPLPTSFAIENPFESGAGRLDMKELNFSQSIFPASVESFYGLPSNLDAKAVFALPPSGNTLADEGYDYQDVWVRLKVAGDGQIRNRVVRVLPALFMSVEFNQFSNSGDLLQTAQFELGHAGHNGALDYPMPSFGLVIPRDGCVLVMRLVAINTPVATFMLESPHQSLNEVSRQNILVGAYFGLLAALMLYNFVVYRVLRQKFLIHYLGVMLAVGLFSACVHGYLDYWFGGDWHFSRKLGVVNYYGLIAGTAFMRSFLMTPRLMPRLDFYHKMVMAISVAGAIVALTPLDPVTSPYVGPGLDILTLFQVVMIWASAWLALKKGFWPARFFILAWFISMVGVFTTCLNLVGILPQDYWIRFSLQFASAGEMLVFAIAVGDRFRKMQQEKVEAARASWQAHRLRTLVDMACHDIASPMAVIQMQADMAESGGGELTPLTLGSIQKAVNQQANIINYIRREQMRVRDEPDQSHLTAISVAEVVTELEFLFSARAKRKGIKLDFPDGDAVRGLWVKADGVALIHSVLGNLVSNAIKFTPRGRGIDVSVVRSGPSSLAFQVRDEGVGIPDAELAMIEAGSWGASVRRKGTDGEEGSGIGLSLVRSLAESFGGQLQIESRLASAKDPSSGTVATVTLIEASEEITSSKSDAPTPRPVPR